ncbi:MAG TPA: plastocyanin/azurin family copper-binding protein [Acidimicrobiia bacterium]|nr:plastocyanin/azurin family copper-binding protein [Acidimicrobiia bacterium]
MSDDETPTPDAADAAEASTAAPEATGDAAKAVVDAPAGTVASADAPVLVAPADAAYPTGPVDRPTFRSKFLAPLIVPVGVAAAIVFYVLNVSRIFLANDETLALVFASVITVLILGGGTALAAAPKVRGSSLTLVVAGSLLVLLLGGLISIGAASPNVASGPTQCTPVKSKITTVAGENNTLSFTPNKLTAKAGCVQLSVKFDGTHTLQFDSGAAASAFPTLDQNQDSWAGTLPAGTYAFHCTIPGHASAGMVGTLTVTS